MTFSTARVAQINILNSEYELEARYKRLVKYLEIINPEVLAVQEVIASPLLDSLLAPLGYVHNHHAEGTMNPMSEITDHTSIYSRLPLVTATELSYADRGDFLRNTTIVGIKFSDSIGFFSSSHFAWGGHTEAHRLYQATRLNAIAQELVENHSKSFFILMGDLNAEDESRTIRYLSGKDLSVDNESSTYWTDSYRIAPNKDIWATSDHSQGFLGPRTASKYGVIDTNLLPARRIDYIMTYGWAYGKLGCAVNHNRFGDPLPGESIELSDHWGLWADILV